MANGRPQKPYQTSWGEVIPGLARDTDGRWRILTTGKRFSEADERRAVDRFRATQQPELVSVPSDVERLPPTPGCSAIFFRSVVTAADYWPWLREQLISNPGHVAKMVGIPEIAHLEYLQPPESPITIDELLRGYLIENPSKEATKKRAVSTFRKLADFAGATKLEDLTQAKMLEWRASVERDPTLTSAGTRAGKYGHVKAILGFGLKIGMDQDQIRTVLDRCQVLWTSEPLPPVQPLPIDRADYHTLLAASDATWRAWLLLALNLCMTAEDLCHLKWSDFDMQARTYRAIRRKTRRDRIPRAGVVWDETASAMEDLPRRSEYVFTSRTGTMYNKNSRVDLFARLREQAGLPTTVKMSHIRDGAYTAACQGAPDERWARVLAGHRAAGLQDNYVLRNPEAVRPACDAVYKVYGPFPVSERLGEQSAAA